MIIAITEYNAWENERWTYVLDVSKQDPATINNLMIFARLANEHFEQVKADARSEQSRMPRLNIPFYRPQLLFAASSYDVKFYDSVKVDERSNRILLKNRTSTLVVGSVANYKDNVVDLNKRISYAKMKATMRIMRDKKQNRIYKEFESLFYKR